MANDRDIDSWDLKPDELGRLPWRNGLRVAPTSKLDRTEQPTCRKDSSGGSPNGFLRHPRPRCSQSGPEVRHLDPIVHSESFDVAEQARRNQVAGTAARSSAIVEANCGDSTFADRLSVLSINEDSPSVDFPGDQPVLPDTYRCQSVTSPTVSSVTLTNTSKSVGRAERRCVIGAPCTHQGSFSERDQYEAQRYTLNGQKVVQISTTSLSTSSISGRRLNGLGLARRIAHEEWVRKKQQAAQQKKEEERQFELRRRNEEERIAREKEEREQRERENFLRWAERKRRKEASKREAQEREAELQRRLKAVEDQAAMAKTIYLKQWARKKEEEQKAQQREQELKQKQIDEERRKRLEESSKAYERWREKSKNRPRPATQGLLPHQKATPTYVNPTPWQRIVDDDNEEEAPTET